MKKAKFLSLILCVIAVFAISALAISAESNTQTCGECTIEWTDDTKTTVKSVTGGVIYALNNKAGSDIWAWNYDTFTAASKGLDKMETLFLKSGDSRVDTGLRYDYAYDTTKKEGVLTVYVKNGWSGTTDYFTNSGKYLGFPNYYMKELVTPGTDAYTKYGIGSGTYEGGYFERSNVKKLIIADEKITAVGVQLFNYFQYLKEIYVTNKLAKLGQNAFSRCYRLESIRVIGCTDIPENASRTADLRNITSTHNSAFSETFSTGTAMTTTTFYVGEGIMKLAESANTQFGRSKGTGDIIVYTPNGESCPWVDAFGNRSVTQWSPEKAYYNVTIYPQSSCVLKECGYQVRTAGYNGLRGVFRYDPFVGKKIIVGGEKQANPETISILSGSGTSELIEYGTIAIADPSNLDTGLDYALTYNDSTGEYETSHEKAKKVKVWTPEKGEMTEEFFVTVVNYPLDPENNNLKTHVFMTAYEIWRDSVSGDVTIKYTADTGAHIKPTSIYEATVGMYRAGLINHSVESDDLFWSILELCREPAKLADDIESKLNYTYYASGVEKKMEKTYSYTIENGDYRNGDVLVSMFKTGSAGNEKYTAIAHPVKNDDGSWKTGVTFKGGVFTSENWARSNYLTEGFTGIPFDTMIIDAGIATVEQEALSGFWYGTSNERADASGKKTAVEYKSSLNTIIYSEDLSKMNGQAFVNSLSVTRVVRFDPDPVDPNYVEAGRGIFDISTKGNNGNYITYSTSYVFSKAGASTVLLPPSAKQQTFADASGMFAYSPNLTRVYCPQAGYGVPDEGTADLRGTGWTFNAETGTINNSTFRYTGSAAGIMTVINDNGTACERISKSNQGFVWTMTGENITVADIPLANYVVDGGEKYTSEAATLQAAIKGLAGDPADGEKGAIVLTSSEDVGYSKCNIKLDGTTITLSVNPYGIAMTDALPYVSEVIKARTTDTITAIDESFSIIEGDMLQNTYYRLTHDKKLNIGYLGGSITYGQGTGATADNCWVGLTTKWFRDNFPNATVKGNNAGIQDTTSDYGLFRLDRDMFVDDDGNEFIPDLFFIEYTSNDGSGGDDPVGKITKQTESIIQRVYEKNPYCDIIFLYTKQTNTQKGFEDMAVYKADHALAVKYGLLELAPGRLLYDMMIDKFGSINNTDLADASGAVHPTAKGYAIYSDYMNEYFEQYLVTNAPMTATYTKTTKISTTGLMMDPHIYGVEKVNVTTSGTWATEDIQLGRGRKAKMDCRMLTSSTNGDSITFEFDGTSFGLMLKRYAAGSNADLSYSVDGGSFVDFTVGSNYSHMRTKMLEYNLTDAHHTVTVKVKEGSTGSTLSIIAFMVNGTMSPAK